ASRVSFGYINITWGLFWDGPRNVEPTPEHHSLQASAPHTSGKTFDPLRMIECATSPIQYRSTVETGFEPGILRLGSLPLGHRDLEASGRKVNVKGFATLSFVTRSLSRITCDKKLCSCTQEVEK
ncbi:hypothetical protein AVEN_45744-1, partial [Araneus ventricosus]